ncbi:hypothetical protein TEA_019993 [Camellia sinensis var. sinensis]|uniref:Nucleoside phosphorylase domain-containing protein n=1 Tax=Camellia sinensis var. sinensis TaxID=542762 RepID=A0A4S4EXL4_CAMSN|nr:hypothetical protein TEA_019993 [Camellia sinensis var. sinensis]
MLNIVILVVVVMGFEVKKTIQLKSNHPLHDVVERINEKGGPYIGVVMAYPTEELALLSSGFFLPSSDLPSLHLSGLLLIPANQGQKNGIATDRERRNESSMWTDIGEAREGGRGGHAGGGGAITGAQVSTIGTESVEAVPKASRANFAPLAFRRGIAVVDDRGAGSEIFSHGELNAGITVQILLDVFDIKGIVHYGIAGSANDSMSLGDVSIPKYVAFTGSWNWKEFHSEKGDLPELKFGAYNFPEKGDNLLAKIEFTSQQLYSNGRPMEEVFWLPIDPKWFSLASQLQDMKLVQCVNETYCLPGTPQVVYGLRASTADIFLDNVAYRKFLFSEFNISTVDEESSAVLMTALTSGVPCIVFRGVSDMAGAIDKLTLSSLYTLAAANAVSVAIEFIGLIGSTYQTLEDH